MYTIKKLRKRGIDYYFKDEVARNLISSIKQKITEITNGGGSAKQVQSDWNESNATSSAYIRNKPLIPSLDDYYTKSETEGMLDGKLSTLIAGTNITIEDNVISATEEVTIDLSNYYTKTEIDNKGYLTQHQDISGKVDKEQGKGLSTNDYTTAEKTKLSDLPTNAQLSQQLSGKANSSDVYPKSLTYTKTEVDNAIGNAVEGLGTGSVKSIIINNIPYTPDSEGNVDLEDIGGIQGQPGADGITPHIDVVTGHWFIGDEDTGIDAHGLQGNSGYTGAVGELEVVEDYTEGGVGKAASAEAVKEMAIKSIPGAGSFADAYEKARANNVVFPWFLRDVDENGNPIEKMIWHNGYRKFVDAIGAEVNGQKNGLTIWVNTACELYFKRGTNDESYYPLAVGENNFSFDDLEWNGSTAIANGGFNVVVREGGTTTSHGNYVDKIDFGGLKLVCKDYLLYNWDSLTKVKRLCVQINIDTDSLLSDCNELVEVQIEGTAGTTGVWKMPMLNGCPKLERADLKDLSIVVKTVQVSSSITKYTQLNGILSRCPLLEYADIRGIDTTQVDTFGANLFTNDTSLKTLVIGNFSNENMASKPADMFLGVTDCVLICTAVTPPALKNCSFDVNDDPEDNYSSTYDWLAYVDTNDNNAVKCHFSAIYVPNAAAETAYKANTYVTGGTVGNTGWSKYASIIHDITGTEYEDLI